jgi:ssDNA-binding Zn-finger/Zn-ribbon topoisomerase 1
MSEVSTIDQNQTDKWVFTPDPSSSEHDVEIARLFWGHTIDVKGVHFTHSMVNLEETLGISAQDIRRIQKSAGVMQPPFSMNCAGRCNHYLNWTRFDTRSAFQTFVAQVARAKWCCSECAKKERDRAAAESDRRRVEREQARVAEQAAKNEQLRARYGDRIVGDCPQCDGVKILRKAGNGGVFIGCSEFPNCDYRSALPQPAPANEVSPQEIAEAKQLLAAAPRCPDCGAAMRFRNGKFGEFLGCTNYPKCRGAVPLLVVQPEAVEEPEEKEEVYEPVLDFVRRIRIALEKPEVDFDYKSEEGKRVYHAVHKVYDILRVTEHHLDPAKDIVGDGFLASHVFADFVANAASIIAATKAEKAAGEKVASELTGLASAGGNTNGL